MSENEWRRRGEAMRERLGLRSDGPEPAPGIEGFVTEAVYGGIWARPGLDPKERMICALTALAQMQRLPQLRRYAAAALDLGLEPRAIQEIAVQCGLYGGIPIAENALEAVNAAFAERGLALPSEPLAEVPLQALETRGRELMEDLHGARGREGYAAPDNDMTAPLYRIAIQYGYGALWFRPGLDRRGRMLCALAAFTVLRLDGTLRKFAQSALNVGLTREEVREAVMQTAPYGGFPVALTALAALDEVR
jgi:4-carboxymuconolactone decarboxylase